MKNKIDNSTSKLVITMLVITAVISLFIRLMPHIPNFTPIGAMCLFAGAYISNRQLALILPLACLFFTDGRFLHFGAKILPHPLPNA